MGTLFQSRYTIPIPDNAIIDGESVTWVSSGKKKKGKLSISKSGEMKVSVSTGIWIARFADENGKTKTVSTKSPSRENALRILHNLEDEVSRIRAGVMSRSDLNRSKAAAEPLESHLDDFRVKMVAGGAGNDHIDNTIRMINVVLDDSDILSLADLSTKHIEKWMASQRESGVRAARTINSHLVALRSFCIWATEMDRLSANPMRRIKKLNEEVDIRKDRRSLTETELKALFKAARERKRYRRKGQPEMCELIYRLLAGTGLRSTELSLATPSRFDFEKCTFRVMATSTKNKKADILPIRKSLIDRLKKWIDDHKIGPRERIFTYDKFSILRSFRADLVAAGLAKKDDNGKIDTRGPDGRTIDVHSLRRTFGTMLARAGVPLTTTQRLMRHSTPELTAKLYIDVEPIDMFRALDKLPEIEEGDDEELGKSR